MKRWAILVAGLALAPLAPGSVEAQVNFGPLLAWGDDSDIGIGGRIDLGQEFLELGLRLVNLGSLFRELLDRRLGQDPILGPVQDHAPRGQLRGHRRLQPGQLDLVRGIVG